MHPRNLFILTLISVCSGAGLGYAQGRNEVAFVSPEITQPGSGGSRVVVQPESIEAVDIATGQKRTLLADTEFVRALAFDAAGNLYFEQQAVPPPDTAREIWKLDTAGHTERVATVYSLVPGANQGADGGSVMAVNRATNEVVFVSPEITSPGAGGNRVVVQSESIETVNIATGQQRTLVAGTKFVRALAYDAAGNLYFEQETVPYPSTTREILKQDPTGQLASIATVFSLIPGLGQGADGGSSIAINRATNELAFISPEITESGPQGSRVVVHPESIEVIDLGTGGQHTLVPHTVLARALTYDAAGNLYFEQQTVPPPDTAREIWKLDTAGHMERLVTVYSLLPGANQGADGSSVVAYNPGQRIFLDWDTPLDIVILRIPDYSTTPVSFTYPAVPQLSQTVSFSENDKDEIFRELQKIFLNSSLDLPILESRIHALPPPMDAVRVRFAPSGAGLLGKAYEGVDQCNERRRNDNIAVFGNPPTGDLTKLMAETSAHEFGHALGLRHMDPFPTSGVEVMDYTEPPSGVTEQFTEGPYEIMEDLHLPQHASTGVFHNAVYHIRAYSLGESRASLESQNVFPGFDWDTACLGQNPSSSRHLSFVNLQYNSPIHHVLVQKEIGPTPAKAGDGPLFEDPKWETIAYLETVDPANASTIEVLWDGFFPLRIAGSSTTTQELDLFLGFGNPSSPQLTISPSSTGRLTGSIFQFSPGTSVPSVVGSFTVRVSSGSTTVIPGILQIAKIEIHGNSFEVKGSLILGDGSDGIDPLHEDVILQVGSFTATLPAGSFKQTNEAKFKFEGVINNAKLELKITVDGDRLEFKAEGKRADLEDLVNPVLVTLTIGNDSGAVDVTADISTPKN